MRIGDRLVAMGAELSPAGGFRLRFSVFSGGRWRAPQWPGLSGPQDYLALLTSWQRRPCVVRHEGTSVALRCLTRYRERWQLIGGRVLTKGVRSPTDVVAQRGHVYALAGGMLDEREDGTSVDGRPVVTLVDWSPGGRVRTARVPVRLAQRGFFVERRGRVCAEYNQYEEASGTLIGASCLLSTRRLQRDIDAPATVHPFVGEPDLDGHEIGVDAIGGGVFPNSARVYAAEMGTYLGSGTVVWFRTSAGLWERGVQTQLVRNGVSNTRFAVIGRRSYHAAQDFLREGPIAHRMTVSVADEANRLVEQRQLAASPDGQRVAIPLAFTEHGGRVLLLSSDNRAQRAARLMLTDVGPAIH